MHRLLIIALAALALTGCSPEQLPPEVKQHKGPTKVMVVVYGGNGMGQYEMANLGRDGWTWDTRADFPNGQSYVVLIKEAGR